MSSPQGFRVSVRDPVKFNLTTKHLMKVVALASRMACAEAMTIVQKGSAQNLERIRAESKWPEPGGYGWWRKKIAHGFMRASFFVASFQKVKAGKKWSQGSRIVAGSFFRMSQIFYPIERGTQNGKRGWQARDGSRGGYDLRQGKRKARRRMVLDFTGRRGASEAKPFLWPSVMENADRVNEALLRNYNENALSENELLVKEKIGVEGIV